MILMTKCHFTIQDGVLHFSVSAECQVKVSVNLNLNFVDSS